MTSFAMSEMISALSPQPAAAINREPTTPINENDPIKEDGTDQDPIKEDLINEVVPSQKQLINKSDEKKKGEASVSSSISSKQLNKAKAKAKAKAKSEKKKKGKAANSISSASISPPKQLNRAEKKKLKQEKKEEKNRFQKGNYCYGHPFGYSDYSDYEYEDFTPEDDQHEQYYGDGTY